MMQLFCLHFAGGSCYSFDFLKNIINQEIEFIGLELPGRGRRIEEELIYQMSSAIDDYVEQIKSYRNNSPYIILGHSMGAVLGFNVVCKLESIGDPPIHLILSGNSGPGIFNKVTKKYKLGKEAFKKELRKLGGIPEEILNNNELYNFFEPIIRADFRILEDRIYNIEEFLKIETPIYALMGNREEHYKEISNWSNFTSGKFQGKILEGDHFFIYTHAKKIASIVQNCFLLHIP